jgi:hypothetical protein
MPSDQRGNDRSTGGDKSWGASDGTDAVSPELVLVAPPDEARRAREQLPESPADEWDRQLAGARASTARRPAEPPPPGPAPAPRRRRWVRRTALVGALLILVATAVTVGLAGSRDDSREKTAQRNVTPARHQSGTVRSQTPPVTTVANKPQKSAPATSRRPSKPKARPRAHSAPKKAPAKKPTRTRGPARPAVVGFVPARTWSWEPRSRTRRYVFTLARNGRRVIAARTTKPRFVLPQRFRFAAGRYRWRVVALTTKPGPRRKLVVDSKFRLSAAGAAAANG